MSRKSSTPAPDATATVTPASAAAAGGEGQDTIGRFRATGLSKRYGDRAVLSGLDLDATAGQVLALTGPNGSGKSTLLRGLAGSERLDSGRIYLDEREVRPTSRRYTDAVYGILDDFTWFPELTLLDHLQLLAPHEQATAALSTFGLREQATQLAWSLSSGQTRRAALCTILVRPWSVLLLDEPEQRLDDAGLTLLADTLNEQAARGRIVVLATHSTRLLSALDTCVAIDLGRR